MENILIQVTQDSMGSGDESLGLKLVTNYLNLIKEEEKLPRFITFYNSGVKLIGNESPCLDSLIEMEKRGVKLIACKTCLSHYKILDKIGVGIAGTMRDIIELQKVAQKIINL